MQNNEATVVLALCSQNANIKPVGSA